MKTSSRLNQERNMHKHHLQAKTVLHKYVGGFWCDRQQEMDFVTGGSVIVDFGVIF